jgi:hypothetical protein
MWTIEKAIDETNLFLNFPENKLFSIDSKCKMEQLSLYDLSLEMPCSEGTGGLR